MRVELPYGPGTLRIDVPDDASVVLPSDLPGLADAGGLVTAALRRPSSGPPLDEVVRPGSRVAVVFPDITRPMPNRVVLPPLLAELERLGAGPGEVTLLCATGTHRPATAAEMRELVGAWIFDRYRIHQHSATDPDHDEVGRIDGVPVLLDRRYLEADARIVTGFVEPHFFAGFSGGPKGVCPGLAALETILEAHSPARIIDPGATWLELDGNPVHGFIRQAAALSPPDMSVDVTINRAREVTGVFAGRLPSAHLEACSFVQRTAVRSVPHAYDIVVSSNAGLPLDRNLYQAVKGMAAAERVVRPGGDILMVSSCIDGFPGDGPFEGIVTSAPSWDHLVDPALAATQDSWQAQVLGRILSTATVHLFSDGIPPDRVRAAHLQPVADPSRTLRRLLDAKGPRPTVCVLPEGPLSVATVAP